MHIPGHGYVAVGETLAEAEPFNQANVLIDGGWAPLAEQKLSARYRHAGPGEEETDEVAEYVVPVRWFASRPKSDAYWEKGMFANQNSACKLRQEFTLDRLATHFGVAAADS